MTLAQCEASRLVVVVVVVVVAAAIVLPVVLYVLYAIVDKTIVPLNHRPVPVVETIPYPVKIPTFDRAVPHWRDRHAVPDTIDTGDTH